MTDTVWDGFSGLDELRHNFAIHDSDLDGVTILLASYESGEWEGRAFVLFERDGKLYEVNASHCSCYGLEGQWDPEETSTAELRYRMEHGNLGSDSFGDVFASDLGRILDERATTGSGDQGATE